MSSPYEAALGERMQQLHPRLLAYFSAIPAGSYGFGSGVFDVVGTPRAWLRPALALLARDGILFPVWQHSVPFTVVNSPGTSENPSVRAVRDFAFSRGPRAMVDEISCEAGVITDRLGTSKRLIAAFDADIVEGALALNSRRVGLRVGTRTLWLARWLAPVVSLEERFDDGADQQRVRVMVTHPLLGRLYEYAGSFSYTIRQGEGIA